jgi:hypothetical protein
MQIPPPLSPGAFKVFKDTASGFGTSNYNRCGLPLSSLFAPN